MMTDQDRIAELSRIKAMVGAHPHLAMSIDFGLKLLKEKPSFERSVLMFATRGYFLLVASCAIAKAAVLHRTLPPLWPR